MGEGWGMIYQPQPGSIPYRVIQHLETLPEGTELSTAELNEFLGQPADLSLAPFLQNARKGGLLESRVPRGERASMWKLAGSSLDSNEDDMPMIQRTVPAQRFNATVWGGSLVLVGVRGREDGAVVLTPEQTQRVRGLVAA